MRRVIPPLSGSHATIVAGEIEGVRAEPDTTEAALPPLPSGHKPRVELRSESAIAASHRLQQPVLAVMLALLAGCAAKSGATKSGAPLAGAAIRQAEKITATEAPHLRARVVGRTPLQYSTGPDPALDRPANVRAASGVDWFGGQLAIVQDDANFIALHDPKTGRIDALALPAGPDGRRLFDDGIGNKPLKLDLESITVLIKEQNQALAFGSGSSPARENIVHLRRDDQDQPQARTIHAPKLFAALRRLHAFAGSELNLEGATDLGNGYLRIFQRGNGAPRGDLQPIDASADLSISELRAHLEDPQNAPVPEIRNLRHYDLGELDGVRLTFSDATAFEGGILFLAAAEASPDAVRDGEVSGSVLGIIDQQGNARWIRLLDEHGQPLKAKPEGLCLDPEDPNRVLMVTDPDAPTSASDLLIVELSGLN